MSEGLQFAEKVVVVTGGAQGIGRAIAGAFHRAGADVVLVDKDAALGRRTANAMNETGAGSGAPGVSLIVADLADEAAIAGIARHVEGLYGSVDVLVNNAGIELDLPFDKVTADAWGHVMAVNLRAPFLLTQALADFFPETGGAVVNISSIHATNAFANAIPYACSKAGLLALTRNLALELAGRKIRVNAICPGYIDTQLWDEYLKSSPDPGRLARETADLHPLGRRGVPEDVAGAALFLSDTSASFITGTHLVIDGGLTIRAHP